MIENKLKYKTLAKLAIINAAIIMLLHIVAGNVKNGSHDNWEYVAFVLADLITLCVSCYILLWLNNLFVKNYNYRNATLYIYSIIIFNALVFLAGQTLSFTPAPILAGILVLFGITTTLFAYKVHHCPGTLKGLKGSYVTITAFSGIFIATLIFLPVGIIASCLSDVVLGVIFYRFA